jgi:hypothetical protein
MLAAAHLDIRDCIVCDDIRQEAAGKETLVGVYTTGISVPRMPWPVSVCVWLRVMWSGEGGLDMEFRLRNPRGAVVAQASGTGQAMRQGRHTSLALRGVRFNADIEGAYEIQWRAATGAWHTVDAFPVMIDRTAPAAS